MCEQGKDVERSRTERDDERWANTRRDKTRKQLRMKVMGVRDVRVSPRGKELGVDEPTNDGGI